jgi:[protein-PII] uridylyltransferase
VEALALHLRERLNAERQAAIKVFCQDRKPERLLKSLRISADKSLIEAWNASSLPDTHALVAVGGYGRGELFPYSDVDVLILLHCKPDEALKAKLESFVQLLWNLGLDIGHGIRTLDECLSESAADVSVQTSLLEARLLAGNRKLFARMRKQYDIAMNAPAYFRAKTLEMQQRHIKYEDTPYSLEPNCKESPGGLRDLQVILWVAKAAGQGDSWQELSEHGLITPFEAQQLRKWERVFKDIRIRLHIAAGRREDRLVFDLQIPVAQGYAYKKNGAEMDLKSASEHMMKQYYLAARAVTLLNTVLLQNLEAQLFPQPHKPQRINERFNEVNSRIDIATDKMFEVNPSTMLEVFLLLAQHPELKGMTARTLRALWHARNGIDADFRRNPLNRELFLRIIQAPRGVMSTLRAMNDAGILGRYLPNFGRIVCQMQHDLFHVYTVDQHILTVMGNLHRFALPEHAHEFPSCSRLMAGFARPWVLYLAALFHDIAKGRGGDHSTLGTADARTFCRQHGVSDEDTDLIAFLVAEHLTMSSIAQKKDLSDEETVRQFAELVGNERRLTALYLLTVADIRGTSPQIWNAWKGKLLEDLYGMTMRVIGGDAPSADRELKERKEQALATLRLYGLMGMEHETLWRQLDVAYFLRHDASDIAWQTRILYYRLQPSQPVVKCRLSPIGEGLQVTVYAGDQADLFARICSYFDRKSFSILDAKIHTTRHGYALDTFLVTTQAFAKNYRDIISLVEHDLTELLQSMAPLPEPSKTRLSRKSRAFPIVPTVDLRPDARGDQYLLSIVANDRTGLLYSIAKVLSQYRINLHTAKIMTMGERAEDVFLVDGEALEDTRTRVRVETDLLDVLRV